MKTVYVGMSADIIHNGHINVIQRASELGRVVVGLLTDEVIASYKRMPLLPWENRKAIIQNIRGVDEVISQDTLDYVPNLMKLKPDYVVHGDDWKEGIQKEIRQRVIEVLKQWDGKLVEVEYTKGVSITQLDEALHAIGTTPHQRLKRLRQLLATKPLVRVLEAHNGLTGLIVEKTKGVRDGKVLEFDALWISSLCDSTAKGKPDIELVDLTSRMNTINDILEVTTKPIILDGDSGGLIEHFVFTVRTCERLGVSAVIIEDKIGLKRNSLFDSGAQQQQDDPEHFAFKISQGKKAQVTDDFMVIARIESLISKAGIEDALARAKTYINAGADAIMIHSNKKDPQEILEFCQRYRGLDRRVPLVAVPSSYSRITETELIEAGVSLVIYANHLIRSAYPAMVKTAESILQNERAFEADESCMPIKEVLTLIPGVD